MQVLLVEPYFGGSHRAWAQGYRDHSEHDVRLLTLPARWWKWRMRGGFVTFGRRAQDLAHEGYRPDVIIVTDMLDLAGFRGVLPTSWASVPCVLYFHESQLTYPDSPQMEPDLSYAFTNWTSAYAADAVVFNSEFHRDVFFEELPRLLRHFPDHRHDDLVDEVAARSSVVPVGVDLSWVSDHRPSEPPLVLWNHRWEHDKDPSGFADAVSSLASLVDFEVALCGESFGNEDTDFDDVRAVLGNRVVQFGYAPLERYRSLVNRSDIVVSTARQEFFGIGVVEAMAAGASPVLPNRLSYPELIPAAIRSDVLYEEGGLVGMLSRMIESAELRRRVSAIAAPAMRRFGWDSSGALLDRLVASMGPRGNPRV